MMPGGHLAVSCALSAGAFAATRSVEATAGVFIGGFLIDVDHYLDYLFVEKQWRRPWPKAFLEYYFESRQKKLFLPLHSWELMALLLWTAIALESVALAAYWIGALVHIVLDIIINGEVALKRPILTYSITFRALHRFAAAELLTVAPAKESDKKGVLAGFFSIRPPVGKEPSP